MTAPFWRRAWSVRDAIEQAPAPATIESLATDIAVQRYLFLHRRFSDEQWLPAFVTAGLFRNLPDARSLEGGWQATNIPAFDYLKSVALRRASEVADILAGLVTTNWWVLRTAVEILPSLNPLDAARVAPSLFEQWALSPVAWNQPQDVAEGIVAVLRVDRRAASDAIGWILQRASADAKGGSLGSFTAHDLEEVVSLLADQTSEVKGELLTRLAGMVVEQSSSILGGKDLAPVMSLSSIYEYDRGLLSVLARSVEALAETSASAFYGDVATASTALLRSQSVLAQELGIRALSHLLDESRVSDRDPGRALLGELLDSFDEVDSDFRLRQACRRLFEKHFGKASTAAQAGLLARLETDCESLDRSKRHRAALWLLALESYLGPREKHLLRELQDEFSGLSDYDEESFVVSTWTGVEGPMSREEMASLEPEAVLGLFAWPGGPGPEEWHGPSSEGLAEAFQELLSSNAPRYTSILETVVSEARETVVPYQVLRGLRRAREENHGLGSSVDLQIAWKAVDGVRRGSYQPGSDAQISGEVVVSEACELVASAGGDLFTKQDVWTVAQRILEEGLSSSDPGPEEASREQNVRDPLQGAINTCRGVALVSCLDLLRTSWKLAEEQQGAEITSSLVDDLQATITQFVRTERNSLVLSVFGRYLPLLINYWPSFFESERDRLLPESAEEREARTWEAVFTTYLRSWAPGVSLFPLLKSAYALAAERVGSDTYPALNVHSSDLIRHLVALSLVPALEEEVSDLLNQAAASVDAEVVGRCLEAVGRAAAAGEVTVPDGWWTRYAAVRFRQKTGYERIRGGEADGLLHVLYGAGVDPSAAAGLILDLAKFLERPDVEDMLEYLSRWGDPPPEVVLALLERASTRGWLDSYYGDRSLIVALVSAAARRSPERGWRVVNAFGELGFFDLEETARELFDKSVEGSGVDVSED